MDEWNFKVRMARNRGKIQFLAWCARTPDLRDGPLEIPLSEEVHFEFADTAEEALSKLKREVLQ
jgi:hypothetical protein